MLQQLCLGETLFFLKMPLPLALQKWPICPHLRSQVLISLFSAHLMVFSLWFLYIHFPDAHILIPFWIVNANRFCDWKACIVERLFSFQVAMETKILPFICIFFYSWVILLNNSPFSVWTFKFFSSDTGHGLFVRVIPVFLLHCSYGVLISPLLTFLTLLIQLAITLKFGTAHNLN